MYNAASLNDGAAARRHPWFGLGNAPVREIEIGIVAAGHPRVAAGPHHVGQLPHVSPPGSPVRGDGVELPQLLSDSGFVGADEAAILTIPIAPLQSLHDAASRQHDGPAGVRESLAAIGDHSVPPSLPVRASSATSRASVVARRTLSP